MPTYGVLESFPLQILTFDDLQEVLAEALVDFPVEIPAGKAKRAWQELAEWVGEALSDAFLHGAEAKERWVPRIEDRVQGLEGVLPNDQGKSIRIAYLALLDRVYGGVFRHALRQMPTALCGGQGGHFCLRRVTMFRYARVRDTDKRALEQVMEFLYQGGPRFEMGFSWQAPGEEPAELDPWGKRR